MNLRLVSLDCPSCGSALRGEGLDTIFFCDHCGDAASLGEEGLEMVESAALVPAAGQSARHWRPAWLIDAEVTVSERIRHKGRRSDGWQEQRTFVIPAFEMGLGDLTRIARALSEVAGETQEVPREPIHGGTLAVDDAVPRDVVLGADAGHGVSGHPRRARTGDRRELSVGGNLACRDHLREFVDAGMCACPNSDRCAR